MNFPAHSGVGSYSYQVGPNISDRIRSYVFDGAGNPLGVRRRRPDGSELERRPGRDLRRRLCDAPAQHAPDFRGGYSNDTLPLIVPGPHQINSFAHVVPTSGSYTAATSGGPVLNGTVDGIVVIFDRDMAQTTIPNADVQVMGPTGAIPGPFTIEPDPTAAQDDPAHPKRAFLIAFPASEVQYLSGTYTASYGPGLTDTHGNALDQNLNAGLYLLDPKRNPNLATTSITYAATGTALVGGTQVSSPFPQAIPDATGSVASATPGVLTSTLNVPDNFNYSALTVQLNISHPNDPDLEIDLVSPTGTVVRLVANQGAAGSHSDFGGRNATTGLLLADTVFDDSATTKIDNGGPPFFGHFQPEQLIYSTLSAGQPGTPLQSGGLWKLVVKDDVPGNVGTLNEWSLTFAKDVPNSGLGEAVLDRATAGFRIFTMDPTNPVSSSNWTAVGPASLDGGGRAGRVGGLAVDPSDSSGNTVYVGGASGGVWKTTDFLTTDPAGPTYVPLTDFGPTFGINIGGLAVFGRNSNTSQSIIIAGTGEGDTGTTGVGFLRSMDGGATWQLLDSTVNVDSSGNYLPINSPLRDHAFVGSTTYKVVVDPTLSATGDVIIYAALSGRNGGIWRSSDGGKTWGVVDPTDPTGKRRVANLPGDATDVALAPYSGTGDAGRQPPEGLRRDAGHDPRRRTRGLPEPQRRPGLEPDGRQHRRPADPGRHRRRQDQGRDRDARPQPQRSPGADRPGQPHS